VLNIIWKLIYNYFVLPLLYISIKIASFINQKIRKGLKERRKLFENLIINFTSFDRNRELIWFHSSSLGEFEQAKPIIQKLKTENKYNILVTFFSPSGYENSLKYPYADVISYLPFDSAINMERFINIVRPDAAVMMRYDIWPNMVWKLNDKNVPILLVDATMRENSRRMLPVSLAFHKLLYRNFNKILAISETDKNNFKKFDIKEDKLNAVGDTRFDRVYQKSIQAKTKNILPESLKKNKIVVAGSTWETDEEILLPVFIKLSRYLDNIVFIIVPHEPTLIHIEKIEQQFTNKIKCIRFSHILEYKDERVIIVDSIGILSILYHYSDVAYVGGSFKNGIHNVLEAAVYGVPVLYGPKIENSQEAVSLSQSGSGFIIKNKNDAYRKFRNLLSNEIERKRLGSISYDFVHKNLGATEKIINEILMFLR